MSGQTQFTERRRQWAREETLRRGYSPNVGDDNFMLVMYALMLTNDGPDCDESMTDYDSADAAVEAAEKGEVNFNDAEAAASDVTFSDVTEPDTSSSDPSTPSDPGDFGTQSDFGGSESSGVESGSSSGGFESSSGGGESGGGGGGGSD